MNKKLSQKLQAVAAETGFSFDSRANAAYGNYKGVLMAITPGVQTGQFNIVTSASVAGSPLDPKALKNEIKTCKAIFGCNVQRYVLTFMVKNGSFSANKVFDNMRPAMDAVVEALSHFGAVNCCVDSGLTDQLDLYMCSGAVLVLSPEAFAARNTSAVKADQSQFLKKENVVGGIVGALLGSLIGVAAIVLVGQLGYVMAICGFVMAVCAFKGYEMLGGKLTKKGVVITVIIMIAMIYIANRADWALSIYRQLAAEGFGSEFDFFTCFRMIGYWLEQELIDSGNYYANLFMLYAFSVLGAFSTVKRSLSDKLSLMTAGVYKLGASETAPAYAGSYEDDIKDEPVDGDMM